MARVQQRVCDRCGAKVEDNPIGARARLTRFDQDYHGTNVDLCVGCSTQFMTWMDDPTGAPPGYRFQPRPCPHNVPCADPEGCSGKELVPA